MKTDTLIYGAAAVVCAGWLLCPGSSQAARRDFNLSVNGDAETCAELKVSSNDGEVAKFADRFTLTRAEAPLLEFNGGDRGNIRVRGWDRADYSVETCKVAVAATRAEAEGLAKGISVTHAAGRLSLNGPAAENGQWRAVLLIHAPKDARVDLETKNGPIDVGGLNGTVKLRAGNGPVAVRDCGGDGGGAHDERADCVFRGPGRGSPERAERADRAEAGERGVGGIATGGADHQRAAGGDAAGEFPQRDAAGDGGERAAGVQRRAVPERVHGRGAHGADAADERVQRHDPAFDGERAGGDPDGE